MPLGLRHVAQRQTCVAQLFISYRQVALCLGVGRIGLGPLLADFQAFREVRFGRWDIAQRQTHVAKPGVGYGQVALHLGV